MIQHPRFPLHRTLLAALLVLLALPAGAETIRHEWRAPASFRHLADDAGARELIAAQPWRTEVIGRPVDPFGKDIPTGE